MLIAVLSLITSLYNGHLNKKFVNVIRGNLSCGEYMRTYSDAIDPYFKVKYRADIFARITASNCASAGGAAQAEAGNAVARFGALATYFANQSDEKTGAVYTALYWKLIKLVAIATTELKAARDMIVAEADTIFADLNEDCVKQATMQPLRPPL